MLLHHLVLVPTTPKMSVRCLPVPNTLFEVLQMLLLWLGVFKEGATTRLRNKASAAGSCSCRRREKALDSAHQEIDTGTCRHSKAIG
jgi:hypothetical protein